MKLLLTAVICIAMGWAAAIVRAGDQPTTRPALAISLVAHAASTQPAGFPLVAEIELTNTGTRPLHFSSNGPAIYPGGETFTAVIVDAHGQSQSEGGFKQHASGQDRGIFTIKPGDISHIPIVLGPLPVGEFSIQFQCAQWFGRGKKGYAELDWPAAQAEPINVTVVDDAGLMAQRRARWLDQIAQGDPVAMDVAVKYPMPDVTAGLVAGLASTDDKSAENCGDVLWHLKEKDLPANTDVAVAGLIHSELAGPGSTVNEYLPMIAGNIGSDVALAGVLEMAHANSAFRSLAIDCLVDFHQPRVVGELRGFLTDPDEAVRVSAARLLARRHDPAAIDVLLDEIYNHGRFRADAVTALANYPDDPRVLPCVEGETGDPAAASEATWAVEQIQFCRKAASRPEQ